MCIGPRCDVIDSGATATGNSRRPHQAQCTFCELTFCRLARGGIDWAETIGQKRLIMDGDDYNGDDEEGDEVIKDGDNIMTKTTTRLR